MKQISTKRFYLFFLIILFFQGIVIILSDNHPKSIGYEYQKIREEFENDNPGVISSFGENLPDDIKIDLAKKIYIEKKIKRKSDSQLRLYISTLNKADKEKLLLNLYGEVSTISEHDSESYKLILLKHDIDVIKAGYNPVNFLMEKVLKLNSPFYLQYQTNIFLIIITILLFICVLVMKVVFLIKTTNKNDRKEVVNSLVIKKNSSIVKDKLKISFKCMKKKETLFVLCMAIVSFFLGFWFKIPNKELTKELMYARAEWKKELYLQQLKSESFFLGDNFDFNWRVSIPFFIISIICLVIYKKLVKKNIIK
ncbi:hypothetical protein [Myroides odoratus]|uniref:hypothetical protein n=1 Tax=Myroides odoratus TaxID=256 RepID=UPI000765A087|nr:hypothetical protein [Myroides odoratus]